MERTSSPAATGPSTSTGADAGPVVPHRWLALGAVSLGVAMTILNATVSNVTVPAIAQDIGLTTAEATWVNASYALVFASLLLLMGRIADLLGRRRVFLAGIVVFALASTAIALSDTVASLIGFRVIQGLAASTILPASLSLLNAVFRGRERAIAFAVWGSIIGGVSALGPVVGGWITEQASWEWAFLLNVPIAAIAFVMALRFVPDSRDTSGERGMDVLGAVLATAGVGLLVFAIIDGQTYGWVVPRKEFVLGGFTWPSTAVSPVFVALIASVVLLLWFIRLERARASAGSVVLLDLTLFRVPSFRYGSLVGLIVSLGEFGLLFAIPLFLQSAYGFSPFETGLILVGLAAGAFVASGASSPLSQRIGSVRTLRLGMVLEVIGIVGLGFALIPDGSVAVIIGWLVVYGFGVGFATSQLAGISLSQVPVEQSGQASGAQSTARQLGAAIGIAVLGATLLAGLGSTTAALTERGVPQDVAEQVTDTMRASAGTAIPSLAARPDGAVLAEGAAEGFSTAVRWASWVAAGFVTVGFVATFLLPTEVNWSNRRRRPEDEGEGPDSDDGTDGPRDEVSDDDADVVDASPVDGTVDEDALVSADRA